MEHASPSICGTQKCQTPEPRPRRTLRTGLWWDLMLSCFARGPPKMKGMAITGRSSTATADVISTPVQKLMSCTPAIPPGLGIQCIFGTDLSIHAAMNIQMTPCMSFIAALSIYVCSPSCIDTTSEHRFLRILCSSSRKSLIFSLAFRNTVAQFHGRVRCRER